MSAIEMGLEPGEVEVADDVDALNYRDVALGPLSSHPHWLKRQGKLLRVVVIGSVTLFYLLALWVWLRSHELSEYVDSLLGWVSGAGGKVALAIVAAATGMLGASMFQSRWAMRQGRDQDMAVDKDAPLSSANLPMIISLVVAALIVPLALTLIPGLSAEARVLGALLAMLPVGLLSFLVSSTDDPEVKAPWSWMLLSILLWGGTLISQVLDRVHEQLSGLFGKWFPAFGTLSGTRAALIALATAATTVLLFKIAGWIASRRRSRTARGQELEGTSQSGKPTSDSPVADIANALGFDPAAMLTLSPDAEEVADWQSKSEFEPYFGGRPLTQDQHNVLTQFSQLADSLIAPARAEDPSSLGVDIIIDGPSGSGLSSTLDAMALISVIERGMCAVIFVPDEGRAKLAIDRLNRKISALNLAHFIVAGPIEAAFVLTAAPSISPTSDATSKDVFGPVPEICVTTPSQWEESLFGRHDSEGPVFERVCHLLGLYCTILVQDYLDHPMPTRLHLPFVVDKHRLYLESAMIPSIRVSTFPRLTDAGRELVIDRLIGHGGIREEVRQVFRLRYRRDLSASVFDVPSDNVAQGIENVTLAIARAGREAVLLRRGIDADEAARQTEDLRSRSQTSGITVCYCHDQVDTLIGELSAIVMRAADGQDAVFALRSRLAEDSVVLIRVRDPRETEPPAAVTPLIVDRSARGMAEAHLQSVLRFVDDCVPVPLRAWGQLGVPGRVAQSTSSGELVGSLSLDLPENISERMRRDRPYLSRLGSFITLVQRFERYVHVDLHMVPDPGPAWWYDGGDEPLGPQLIRVPALAEPKAERQTTVLWKGNDRVELGRSQIHYLDELLLRRRQVFCPDFFERDRSGALEIRGMRFRDNGQDAIHPKFEFSWRMVEEGAAHSDAPPSTAANEPLLAIGGPDHGFLWVEYPLPEGGEVNGTLRQRTDDLDRPTPTGEHGFNYRATFRLLLLMPTSAVVDRYAECKAALVQWLADDTQWGTEHPAFLPGITYAFARALSEDLSSTSFLGKLLAFRLDGAMAEFSSAVLWFVEPLGTGATLSNAIHELLRSKSYLPELASRMDRMLAQGWDKSPPKTLAMFWLPANRRTPVSNYERSLIWKLRRLGGREGLQQRIGVGRAKLICPHCKIELEVDIDLARGAGFPVHCDRIIAFVVPSADGQLTTPKALLQPWWPADLVLPRGSVQEKVVSVWRSVAERVTYIKDEKQLEGLNECWLTATETWARREGDCEDHAILVVAMLAKLGIRSWLTLGKVNDGGGHAWVEVEIESRLLRLEATAKEPLPDVLPDVDDTALLIRYQLDYQIGLYEPFDQVPSRTDGKSYHAWIDGGWQALDLAEPVELTTPDVMP